MKATGAAIAILLFLAGCGSGSNPASDSYVGDDGAPDTINSDSTLADGADARDTAGYPDISTFSLDRHPTDEEDTPQDAAVDALGDTGDSTAADSLHDDSMDSEVANRPGPDTASDAMPPDESWPLDLPNEDAPADAPADAIDDGASDVLPPTDVYDAVAGDAIPDTACPSLACNIECPGGYKTDAAGCPVCRCRECDVMEDCFFLDGFLCDTPICSPSGDCSCDCAAFTDYNYVCPLGTTINMGRCTGAGVTYLERVEEECPSLCSADESVLVTCPDAINHEWCTCIANECRPLCRNERSAAEGWYDGCTGELVKATPCAGHGVYCGSIGTKSEGWYDTAGNLLRYDSCKPAKNCPPIADTCPTLECDGTPQTGTVTCPSGKETSFCQCDSGIWKCLNYPYSVCGSHWRGCVKEGQALADATWLQCCAGTVRLRGVIDDGTGCVADQTRPFGSCSACGDGVCLAPEDRCNCPEDCLDGLFPGDNGTECNRSSECPPGLECISARCVP